MARYRVAPTKSSLLKIKRDYALALEGHRFLEQKREILVSELTGLIARASEAQKEVDASLKDAFSSLNEAIVREGRSGVNAAAQAVGPSAEITMSRREVIGVHLPVVAAVLRKHSLSYSLRGTSSRIDEAAVRFKEAFSRMVRLAELQGALVRVSAEIRKTVRKVNVLEQIHLPDYRETIKYINDTLDEQGREAFFVLKLIKARIGRDKGLS